MGIEQQQAKPADGMGFGIVLAAGGVYFVLVALGMLPMPEGGANAPPFIVALAGLAFLFAGGSVMIRARAGARDSDANLPANAPPWTHMSYRIAGIAIAGTLALIGTWIAIGGGPRAFTMPGAIAGPLPMGELIGRAVFGLGAVIVWIYVVALTVGMLRKLFDRGESR
jgi:hypothetical protein